MTTLTPTDLTNLRDRQHAGIFYLSVFHPTVLLSAQVNNASIIAGARSIAYDTGTGSGFAYIQGGQTMTVVTSTGTRKIRIKSVTGSQSAGTIVVQENAIDWADNQVIEILHNYDLWAIPPTIRNGVHYKDYDVPYNNFGRQPTPVVIMGGNRVGQIKGGTIQGQIITGNDNGLVWPASPSNYFPNVDPIFFGRESGANANAWFRFQNISIPPGAIITAATLTLVSDRDQSTTVTLNIYGEDADNPTAPTSYADYNSRTNTDAVTAWNFSTAWTAGQSVTTPDISAIVQEIVDRSGWASGNAMQLFIKNNGGTAQRLIDNLSAMLSVTYALNPTFTLSASESYAIASGASILSYTWSCIHNGGGTSGITIASASSATTTMTITEAGEYWLSCAVTDSNGKSQASRRVVIIHDEDSLPYTDFNIQNFSGNWSSGGWKLSIEAFGDVTLDDFSDNAQIILWYENYFDPATDNELGYVNLLDREANVLFSGYIRRDTDTDQPGQGTGSILFEMTTPENLLDNLTDFSTISLNSVSSPGYWWQYATWLTVGQGIHHYLKWQTTLLDVCDVSGLTANTLPVKNISFTESSVKQRIDSLAYGRGIFARLVSNRLGNLRLVTDSQMLNATGRAALDTIFTIGTEDITDAVAIPREPEEQVATISLDGFVWDGSTQTAVLSVAPGYRESSISWAVPRARGVGTQQVKNQVVSDQTDANEKAGRSLAAANNPYKEFRVTFAGNYIGAFDLWCNLGFYEWGITNTDLLRQLPLNGTRLICREIAPKIDANTGTVSVDVYFDIEALGADGILGNYPTSYPVAKTTTPVWNPAYAELWAGSTDSGVFLKNWGQAFTTKNTGLSGTDLNIRCLKINPITGVTWIANQTGLAYSTDGGNNWIEISKADMGTPDNAAEDSPAPDTEDLDQIWIDFDSQGWLYLLRTQASPKRAWMYVYDSLTWTNYELSNP